jgi:formylmethanofuran dehydrogenase subunit C
MIRLTLSGRPPVRLSLDGILPERLEGLAEGAARELPVLCGNRRGRLGDWFSVEVGGGAADPLVIAGGSDRLDHVGAGMTRGEIRVEGDVGAALGLGMSGGRVVVTGNAGPDVAGAMRGGEIRVGRNVGDRLGGALPGERAGMSDGKVVVGGNAGSGLGDRMRRGLIVVAGSAGPFCGARMVAGTIVVGGEIGAHSGIAMRRGTILALGGRPSVRASFAASGVHELAFARLLARALAGDGIDALLPRLGRLERWVGDRAIAGTGEILTPAAGARS